MFIRYIILYKGIFNLKKTSGKPEQLRFRNLSAQITAKLPAMTLNSIHHIFRCGSISIDPQSGIVKNTQQSVRLGPVNMQVLVALLESQGQVVSRTELFDRVWKNQIISDDTLTRCISDLRSQLRKFSELENLIETLPKRGYRWIPETCKELQTSSPILETVVTEENQPPAKNWRSYLLWGFSGIVLLLMLSTSVLWITSQVIRPDLVRVALIPIRIDQPQHKSIAANLEENLLNQILPRNSIRFLSSSAIESRPQNPFPYLTREFGTQWIIEGKVRSYQQKIRVTLNLVDARTAMVTYSLTKDLDNKPDSTQAFSKEFIAEMVRILGIKNDS